MHVWFIMHVFVSVETTTGITRLCTNITYVCMCIFRLPCVVNQAWHKLHMMVMVWLIMCALRLLHAVNCLWHTSHVNGLSCVFLCLLRQPA